MSPTVPTPAQSLSLYRSLLRSARLFSNYNFRHYVARRSSDAFRQFKLCTDPAVLATAYTKGLYDLGVARRQGTIDQMYKSERLVLEPGSSKSTPGLGYHVYRNQ
ncbi:hypothetical protein HDU98_011199 [Podochytrium sp. JEL0797]|nr:hypothetical protein HDU98_011199 [Podochytrium sp. JEL0797]